MPMVCHSVRMTADGKTNLTFEYRTTFLFLIDFFNSRLTLWYDTPDRRAASQYCVSKGMQILVVFSSSVSALYFVFLVKLKAAHQAKEHCFRHQERT